MSQAAPAPVIAMTAKDDPKLLVAMTARETCSSVFVVGAVPEVRTRLRYQSTELRASLAVKEAGEIDSRDGSPNRFDCPTAKFDPYWSYQPDGWAFPPPARLSCGIWFGSPRKTLPRRMLKRLSVSDISYRASAGASLACIRFPG